MAHRHYGLRATKPRHAYTGPARTGTWSGSALIGMVAVVLIATALLVYGVNKTINESDNAVTSAQRTTGEGPGR